MKQHYSIPYHRYPSTEELPPQDRELVAEAERATSTAHAPYSNFRVGVAARLRSGTILRAANCESEAFPSGMCAERSLIYYHSSAYADDAIEALAIASNPSAGECYPCGACRQALLDAERRQQSDVRVIMSGGGTATVVERAEYLLPFSFTL